MKQIPLSQGKFALVDDDMYETINKRPWQLSTKGYAVNRSRGVTTHMHRLVLPPPDGMFIDHIDGDKLNNQRSNLRVCTNQQNHANRGLNKNNTSGYKGVIVNGSKWEARIKFNYKTLHLGSFSDIIDAAQMYNAKAKELFGEFARLNEIPNDQKG